ncbi:MAG: tryptophan--tRNA ligase [Ferrimicrobium sp.]
MDRQRVVSGIQPTGHVQLGNYLGAMVGWVQDQYRFDSLFVIVDLHALTAEPDPRALRLASLSTAALFIAAGIDPEVATVFVQSQVPEHTQLAWVMECIATYGELSRMTQFKDKGAGKGSKMVRAGLFTYPALMAADILLYQATCVPVGEDQVQHLELTRDLASRFNARFGETFVVPRAQLQGHASRVMDLVDPSTKMSKSSQSDAGRVSLLDPPEMITRKVMRAKTDAFGEVAYKPEDPDRRGVTNLLEIFAALEGVDPETIASRYEGYGLLKADLAAALIERLGPIVRRYEELMSDQGELERLLGRGAQRARSIASETLRVVYDRLGLMG